MINVIVACDECGGIGYKGKLPWHYPGDLQRFKKLTTGNIVIMGRKTWESLPIKPLPNRENIVLSRCRSERAIRNLFRDYSTKDVWVGDSLKSIMRILDSRYDVTKKDPPEVPIYEYTPKMLRPEVFIIGGGQVYQEAFDLEIVDRIYITRIRGQYEADTFFKIPCDGRYKWVDDGRAFSYSNKYSTQVLHRVDCITKAVSSELPYE